LLFTSFIRELFFQLGKAFFKVSALDDAVKDRAQISEFAAQVHVNLTTFSLVDQSCQISP